MCQVFNFEHLGKRVLIKIRCSILLQLNVWMIYLTSGPAA